MTTAYSFGTWLRAYRQQSGLTQAELALRVGCATITIRKYEADVMRPSRGLAERLADVLPICPRERTAFVDFARGRNHYPPGLCSRDDRRWSEGADDITTLRCCCQTALPMVTSLAALTPVGSGADQQRGVTSGAEITPTSGLVDCLEHALDRHYRQLDDNAQELFPRLSVFSAAFNRLAVESVCNVIEVSLDAAAALPVVDVQRGLHSLSRAGLLRQVLEHGPEGRWVMPQPIRDYALRHLDTNEPELRRRHAVYYLGLLDRMTHVLTGRDERVDTLVWLVDDLAELQAAVTWLRGMSGSAY